MAPRLSVTTSGKNRAPVEADSDKEVVVYRCTACEEKITTSYDAYLHPMLNCLICRKCHIEYRSGDFSEFEDGVDEEGVDNFCRWCVDGGNLFACCNQDRQPDKCTVVFCQPCVERNVPDDPVLQPPTDNDFKWYCYACDSLPLKDLRKEAQDAILFLSQRDLKRSKESSVPNGAQSSQRGSGDKASTTNGVSSRSTSETTPPPEPRTTPKAPAPATSTTNKGTSKAAAPDDDKSTPSSSSGGGGGSSGKNDKEAEDSGSERKKRRTEAPVLSSTPTAHESERRESITSSKKKDKDDEAYRDPASSRLPETLVKPQQAQTSLRNLGRQSAGTTGLRPQIHTTSSASRHSIGPQTTSTPPTVSAGNSISRSSIPTAVSAKAAPPSEPASKPTQQPTATAAKSSTKTAPPSTATPVPVTATATTTTTTTTTATPAKTPTTTAPSNTAATIPSTTPAVTPVTTNSAPATVPPTARLRLSSSIMTENNDVAPKNAGPTSSTIMGPHSRGPNKPTRGLKPNNEQSAHATTRVKLTEQDLKARLENFRSVKDRCVKEMDIKFQNITEMFTDKDTDDKGIIRREIEDLETPLLEIQTMLVNLKSLYSLHRN